MRWDDPARAAWGAEGPRPVAVLLWYPAADGAVEQDWQVAPFEALPVAVGAAPAPGRRPLLLLSHGTGGSAASLGWLAHELAAAGYLVAALNHHGNTAAEPQTRLEGSVAWWERPLDLRVAADRLLADPAWGPRIDAGRIGVAGFSLGGLTALASAGARPRWAAWRAACAVTKTTPGCALPPEAAARSTAADVAALQRSEGFAPSLVRAGADLHDGRVRAAFVIAPAMSAALAHEPLAVPVQVVAGEADDQVDLADLRVWGQVPGVSVELLPGVTHYAFLMRCSVSGRFFAAAICRDPAGLDRARLHAGTAARARAFFDRHLAPR
ncbi:peptidase [Rubrivivax gelatinosus]|nr:peptidase [Rubrivivax gelatinosus]